MSEYIIPILHDVKIYFIIVFNVQNTGCILHFIKDLNIIISNN